MPSQSSLDGVNTALLMDVESGENQPGERLVVSGRAAGGSASEVGAGADVLKGPVLCLTHLSHTFSRLTALPRGSRGAAVPSIVQWCHAGLPVALQQSVLPLPALLHSPGKSSLCRLPAH